MCNTKETRKGMSPLAVKLAKITVVVIFCCFAECAAGSCLSYGHACWGAHGKRSGNAPATHEETPDLVPRWFLSRLVPSSSRYDNKENPREMYADGQLDADAIRGQEDYRNLQEALNEEENVLYDEVYARQRPHSRKVRATKPFVSYWHQIATID